MLHTSLDTVIPVDTGSTPAFAFGAYPAEPDNLLFADRRSLQYRSIR
jgi:hypothetical protein